MTADQNDYALSLSQDELHALATLIHDECKCVPQNNGGGDCDWCRVYYATTDLAEEITACVTDLRLQVDSNRRALGQEICEGLEVRGHQAPKDTASSNIIGALFRVIDSYAERDNLMTDALQRLGPMPTLHEGNRASIMLRREDYEQIAAVKGKL